MTNEELTALWLNDDTYEEFVDELCYAFNNTVDEDKIELLMTIIEKWYDARFVDHGVAKRLRAFI